MPAQKSSPEVQEVEDFFAPAPTGKQASLQDAFTKFRDSKIKEAQERKKKGLDTKKQRTQAQKDALRQKWIDALKKYIGVPYAKRYVEEGSDEWNKGVFLDCCALLRQASADLESEWGWKLGRWNQTYQYALCSKQVEEKDMKPGDLIFYEATYHDHWRKAQHWNITHIEVYLGPGKQTIGSRWKQHVAFHDTYELGTDDFPSKLWKVHKFHFMSLEPWLESFTLPEFTIAEAYEKFPVMPPPSNHKSIFFVPETEVEGGEEDETSKK
ncbi:unnamed protein product [Amoebophrya sp. A25]|nr:unnamed protein product [Amoebophrya sp. A25]|eukprot:GSA25T00011145001.1